MVNWVSIVFKVCSINLIWLFLVIRLLMIVDVVYGKVYSCKLEVDYDIGWLFVGKE